MANGSGRKIENLQRMTIEKTIHKQKYKSQIVSNERLIKDGEVG